MLPYDWETDPWNWLEQRSEYSCLRVDYSFVDRDRVYGERQRPGLRLVKIEPGAAQDPLRCSLTSLDSEALLAKGPDKERINPYEAVSYVWGRTDDPVPIHCKTDELELDYSYSRITITKNCAEVFRRLRSLSQTRPVWIDAISIDQADTADRTHYVRQMHDIYRDAERVLVFLPNYKKASGEYWAESKPGAWIFTHPYFTRIWILQEVFWGRNPVVYAGHHELQWSEVCSLYHTELRGGILLSKETQRSVELVLEMGKSTTKSISGGNKRGSLLGLYQMSKSFQATDQRDKLIALISMATDVSPHMEAILVDYTVTHDVLLRRFAATICFRSLNIMPGIERGIDNSQSQIGTHVGLQNCTKKIENFMTLSITESSDLIKTLSLRIAKQYVWDVRGNDPSFRRSLYEILSEELSIRHPFHSIMAILVCVLTIAMVACLGTDRLEKRRLFSGSQSRKMTVSELLGTIANSSALVHAAHSDDQAFSRLRHKDRVLIPGASRNAIMEHATTVRAVILGYEHFDLCLVPGDVNGLQSRCKRALVKFRSNARDPPSPPVPLLLRTTSGRQRVLGPFYDFEPTPARPSPSCCHVPLVEHVDSESSEAISILDYEELSFKLIEWFGFLYQSMQ